MLDNLKGDDYIPEKEQYLKRFRELIGSKNTLVSEYVNLMLRDLESYSRGELQLVDIENSYPEIYVEMDNEKFPNRQDIVAYNHIRNRLLEIYKDI